MKGQELTLRHFRWIPACLITLVFTSWHPTLGGPLQGSTLAADTVIKKDKGKSTKAEPSKPSEKALTPQEPKEPSKTYKYTLPESGRDFDRHDEDWDEWADDLEETIEDMVEELTRGLSSMRFNINIEPDLEDLRDLDELADLDIDIDIDDDAFRDLEFRSRELEDRAREMDRRMRDKFDNGEWEERMRRKEEEIEHRSEDMARDIERSMESWGRSFELKMKDFERKMHDWEEELKEFEEELQEQLIEDGYLRKGEKIRELHWDDDGDIEINGREIREEDESKYRDLHRKYFGKGSRRFHYVE